MEKRTRPITIVFFRPFRYAYGPAPMRREALTTHSISVNDAPRDRPIAGRETVTMFESSMISEETSEVVRNIQNFARPSPALCSICMAASGVDGFTVRRVRIVLRSLATVVHTVVPDNTNTAQTRAFGDPCGILEVFCHSVISPGHHQDQVAGRQNGVENIPRNEARERPEPQPLRTICRVVCFLPFRRTLCVDQRDGGSLTNFCLIETLLLKRASFGYSRILSHLSDSHMVVGQYVTATAFLNLVMAHLGAPTVHGFFVPPVRERQDPASPSQ